MTTRSVFAFPDLMRHEELFLSATELPPIRKKSGSRAGYLTTSGFAPCFLLKASTHQPQKTTIIVTAGAY
jgi:hypothetical protein